jgi:hypothetical protein
MPRAPLPDWTALFTPSHILPPMSYTEEVDRWLDELLNLPDDQCSEVKRAIKDKLLESYRNGQNAPRRTDDRSRGQWRGRGSRS